MNGKTIRVLSMAAALLAGGTMMHPSMLAQADSTDKAKPASAAKTESPSEVYGKLLKMISTQVIGAAEAMPADKYEFAPTTGQFEGVSNFSSQVRHLAEANYYFYSGFGIGAMPDEAKFKSLKTKDELVQALKDSYAYAEKGVDSMTAQNAFQTVPFGKETITRAGAATLGLSHSMDHYGQLVEYLRMNGIVPPASRKKS